MKQLGPVVSLLSLALAVALPAAASGPTRDIARGRIVEPDGRTIKFNAKSLANGTMPTGRITVNFRPDERVTETFEVNCLAALGNRATLIGTLTKVRPKKFQTAVTGIVLWVRDNAGLGMADRYDYILLSGQPAVCQPTSAPLSSAVTKGKIRVRDAS